MDITKVVLYGVLILISINFLLFFVLLINKARNNKKAKENKRLSLFFEAMIYQYVNEKNAESPKPKNGMEKYILNNIILESFAKYEFSYHDQLRRLAEETGFVAEEMRALKNSSDLRKSAAAYALGILKIKEALPVLKKIRSEKKELSQCITRALIQIGGTEEIDNVITNMLQVDYPQKPKLLELLTEIMEDDIFPEMEKYLLGEDPMKKSLAIETLGARKDERVKPYILEGLFSDVKEVKISALKAAISLKCFDFEELEKQIDCLLQDKDWEIRAFTAKAMSNTKNIDEKVIEGLKKLMEDSNWFVRFNASESLLLLGEKGVEALSENLFSEDTFTREKAWGIINREIALYELLKKISGFSNSERILMNIKKYKEIRMEVQRNVS